MKTATLGIIVKDGRVLLGYKKKGVEEISDIVNGPGGKIEPNETKEECLARETFDEMRVRLDPATLEEVAVITFHVKGVPTFKVHVLWTDRIEGEPQETGVMVPEWFERENLPWGRMAEADYQWFPRALRREKFCANVYYREPAKGLERPVEFLPYAA